MSSLPTNSFPGDALAIAAAVRARTISAADITEAALARIADDRCNCFTQVTAERARREAESIDRALAEGRDPGPLAGVPYAVKNLFDIEGVGTLAGSKINRDDPPALSDATAIQRLQKAGAVLTGALNMDEYAYGFTTENAHDGATRNPLDPARSAGGSSGGSAAAVAAGLVPVTLGSDTNGSIRVPAAFCGIFGLKPTFGRLSRGGSFPFVHSLDHVGPFAGNVTDLARFYDALQGADGRDPVTAGRLVTPATPLLHALPSRLKVGVLGGWFRQGAAEAAVAAVARVGVALGGARVTDLPDAEAARAAAFCMTAAEGGALHLDRLRRRAHDFDPATRDRLIAGALMPASIVARARRFRRWFAERAAERFAEFDLLLAPSTPVWIEGEAMPLGVQIIAPPWREDLALAAAALLERDGVVGRKPA
jgi:AtzE family amidohydrolase